MQALNRATMKEIKTYYCEICGKCSKNRVLIVNHEKQCKVTYEAERQLEQRLTALFALLRKKGYKLTISIDDKYGNEFINCKYSK